MKRSLWIQPLTEQSSPAWPCPACTDGTLALIPNSLVSKETIESKQRYEILGDPESITCTFSAWLRCSYGGCGEKVVVAGKGILERIKEWEWAEQGIPENAIPCDNYKQIYQPLFCCPMPAMFELPNKCPAEVAAELRSGFRLFWLDQAASAGRVRVSLERLMDYYHIPKRCKDTKGKYHDLKLHARIDRFSKTQPSAGDKLMAIKWLGNTASHQGDVSRDDLLDGFEILEYVLADLFEKRAIRVTALTRQLTKKHAPKQKRSRASSHSTHPPKV